MTLEEIIRKLANRIIVYTTQKTRKKEVHEFLSDWNISRLTEKKRKELKEVFENNDLEIYDENDIKKDFKHLDRKERIYIKYAPTNSTGIDYSKIDMTSLADEKVEMESAGEITREKGDNPRNLHKHQEEVLQSLNKKIKPNFSGLLVIPTGGGKTYTAVYWLLKNVIDKGQKVLWIAHRHALLDQAVDTFKSNAYSNVLKNKQTFQYRVISGFNKHDQPVHIQAEDDIIVASKDSLGRDLKGKQYFLKKWIQKNNLKELVLVIDEAHHAVARTYRETIENLRKEIKNLTVLGLIATPYRTAPKEAGLLKKVFTNDIVNESISLRTLINRGILSEPIFEEAKTEIDMTQEVSDEDLKNIQNFDIQSIGKDIAKNIAENKERNNLIVKTYKENRKKYQQTILFALNKDNALALDALFKAKGIKSDYVMSDVRDMNTKVTVSSKDNEKKLQKFRNKEIQVLININILTEGVDVPSVQTVFLTRPTISKTLMMQMIGRGLRGEKAGGTKNTYIVSFIDDWKDKVEWINPEQLHIEESNDFNDTSAEYQKRLIRLISIAKIKEFALLMDKTIPQAEREVIEALDFLERIPVGTYHISFPESNDQEHEDTNNEKSYHIMVYDRLESDYQNLINDLDTLGLEKEWSDEDLEQLSQKVTQKYFLGLEDEVGFDSKDIFNILKSYNLIPAKPKFIEFKEKNNYDLSKVAHEIYEKGLGGKKKKEYIDKLWEQESSRWRTFFGYNNKKIFKEEIDLAIRKIEEPEHYTKSMQKPENTPESRELKKLSLDQIRKHNPKYWKYLHDTVYQNAKNNEGYYVCARTGYKSKRRNDFQIDHIKPRSKGGLSVLENLQLLERSENMRKGDKID